MDKAEIIKAHVRALQDALLEVQPDVMLSHKSMFGGAGYFADGKIFAAWFGSGLALKLSPADQRDLLAIDGAAPTQSAAYIELPPALLTDPAALAPWVAKSLAFIRK